MNMHSKILLKLNLFTIKFAYAAGNKPETGRALNTRAFMGSEKQSQRDTDQTSSYILTQIYVEIRQSQQEGNSYDRRATFTLVWGRRFINQRTSDQ